MTQDKTSPSRPFKKYAGPAILAAVVLAYFGYLWAVSGVLPSEDQYPSGKRRAIGYVKRHGLSTYRKEGRWVTYHKNGTQASDGFYDNGKKTGDWSYWDADGNPLPAEPTADP